MPSKLVRLLLALRVLPLAATTLVVSASDTQPTYQADFARDGLRDWVVEQQPGGTVTIEDDTLLITDVAGCTVWFKPKLSAPLTIRYQIAVTSAGRISDLNCFWMASDPDHPDDLFAEDHGRTGKFATYDQLRLYYVGYGGNMNSTTRFRRYDGTGARPLDEQHDLQTPEYLLIPDHVYTIELSVTAEGKVTYTRDGKVIYEITDPEPLKTGWFGFRTVNSTTRITSFEVLH